MNANQCIAMPEWSALYRSVLECDQPGLIADAILEPLRAALTACSAVYLPLVRTPSGDSQFGSPHYVGSAPGAVEPYVDEFHLLDPIMRPIIGWTDCLFRDRPRVVLRLPSRDRYAERFLKPFDIGPVLSLVFPVQSGSEVQLACIGFHRPFDGVAFGEDQKILLEHLAPAIQATLERMAYREALMFSNAMAAALLTAASGTNAHVMVFDDDLMLRAQLPTEVSDEGALSATTRNRELLGEIRHAVLIGELVSDDATTIRTEGGSFDVALHNLSSPDGQTFHLATIRKSFFNKAFEQAASCFLLTAREIEVVSLVAAGDGNAALGRKLGISLRTAENHLRAIYRKVGVSSRTQLISRILQCADGSVHLPE